MNLMQQRINRVMDELPLGMSRSDIDGILVFNKDVLDKNFLYITGIFQGVFENCGIFFTGNGESFLFTTDLEREILSPLESIAHFYVYRTEEQSKETFKKVLSGYRRIGVNYKSVSHSFFIWLQELLPSLELIDVGSAFRKARMQKTTDEILRIQHACDIASEVANQLPTFIQRGITELELAAEIEYRMKKKGASGPAFTTIVAFGENSSKPHYSGGKVSLEDQHEILVDFGAVYEGYVSDITQTYLLDTAPEKLMDIYTTVLNAQQLAIGMIREGANARKVEDEVRRYIDSIDDYSGKFIHSLGHSIGLNVHDDSYPSKDWNYLFMKNMVITVEPGIYIPGKYGVRLEDDILVQEKGCKVLTTGKKELITYALQ